MVRPQVADRRDGLQKWRIAANMLNKQSWRADKDGPPAWELVEGLKIPQRKKKPPVTNPLEKPRNWTGNG